MAGCHAVANSDMAAANEAVWRAGETNGVKNT